MGAAAPLYENKAGCEELQLPYCLQGLELAPAAGAGLGIWPGKAPYSGLGAGGGHVPAEEGQELAYKWDGCALGRGKTSIVLTSPSVLSHRGPK